MELRQLRSFLALAEKRHFGKAADEVGLSQPALSQQIKALEKELGATLVVRNPAGLHLTEAGQQFLVHARRILRDVEDAADSVDPQRNKKPRPLRIGHTSRSRDEAFIAADNLARTARGLRVVLDDLSAQEIEARILEGRLDVGVVESWTVKDDVVHELVAEAPLVLLFNPRAAPAFASAGRSSIQRLDELAEEDFVLPHAGDRLRGIIDSYFERERFVPRIAAETNSIATALRFVSARRGVTVASAILSHFGRANLPQKYRFVSEVGLPDAPRVGTYLLWRDAEIRSTTERAFGAQLHEVLSEWREPPKARSGIG
jgi:DNA-binding transcriptional LysR family regulator